MQDLLGKVALISGGTTGIGLAAAKAFVASGAKVVVAARNPERGINPHHKKKEIAETVGTLQIIFDLGNLFLIPNRIDECYFSNYLS